MRDSTGRSGNPPDSPAIRQFKRTGAILPGSQSEIAGWLAENNGEQEATDG